MKELTNASVRFISERISLVQERIEIQDLPQEERLIEEVKWEAKLKQHKYEFREEWSFADEIQMSASVVAIVDNSWIAMYRHSSAETDSVFKAKASFVTPAIKQILGSDVDPSDLGSWMKHMDPEDTPRVMRAQVRSRDFFEPFDQRWRTWHPDLEEWRYVHAISRAVWDDSDPLMPCWFEGAIMDVTEQERANQKERDEITSKNKETLKSAFLKLAEPYPD